MKKMKKFLGIMLAMVMAVTMLAGCGGSSKESSSSDNGKTLKLSSFFNVSRSEVEVTFSTRLMSPFCNANALLSSLKKSISTLS